MSTPPEKDKIALLSRQYFASDYDTAALLKTIFTADWFYRPESMGSQIKSPVVFLVGLRRKLGLTFNNPQAQLRILRALGQTLFHPPNVAGWPGGRHWIDNATLLLRLNLGAGILSGKEVDLRFRDQPEVEILSDPAVRRLEATVDLAPLQIFCTGLDTWRNFQHLSSFMLAQDTRLQADRVAALVDDAQGEERLRRLLLLILTLPEFQMC